MSSTENTAPEKRDVYERVTSQIVNAIEQGVSNWRMPWHTSGKFAFSPINVASTSRDFRSGYRQGPRFRCGQRQEKRAVQALLEEEQRQEITLRGDPSGVHAG